MPDDQQTLPTHLDVVLSASHEIAQTGLGDPYRFYELLHQTAARIARVDAFYVCLYSEAEQTLFFCYNYDNGVYDFPSTYPLGSGPTSRAIQQREPVVWNTDQEARERRGVNFGDTGTFSHSAVTVPIYKPGCRLNAPVLGVLSAQCYVPHAYDDQAIRLFEWLADRAGEVMASHEAVSLAAERLRHMTALSDRFVQMLNGISREAQAARALVPLGNTPLQQAMSQLLQSCYRSQTEANQFLLQPPPLPVPTPTAADAADPLVLLTEREREILRLLAGGHANSEIADRLFITANTVKDHLKRIYAKLGVNSRYQAIQKFQSASQ